MNFKIDIYTIGKALFIEALMMLLPAIVSVIYKESVKPFMFSIIIAAMLASAMIAIGRNHKEKIYARDGYIIVTLSWVFLSLIGALPFYLSKSIPAYIDALFESVSGFTTTGASILTDVESMGKGLLFWRSLTHWIGGMGVLVFVLAIANRNPNQSFRIMKAEMPGSRIDKLKPKAKGTATTLYLIYICMTFIETALLFIGGMPLYDSIVHSLGTAGTGGFGIYNDSIGGASAYSQWIIALFMMLFAINFAIYFFILNRNWRSIIHSTELKWFLSIVVIATLIITVFNQRVYTTISENLRLSFFQVTSIISTTGYSTADFNMWPGTCKIVLFLLMFIGGCEGSTAGGLKVSRVMTMFYSVKNALRKIGSPRRINTVRIGGKPVSSELTSAISTYFLLYLIIAAVALLVVSHEPFGLETNLSAVISCLNNIGPGFAAVGPAASYAAYSAGSKIVLAITMLLGRLEIYPIILSLPRVASY